MEIEQGRLIHSEGFECLFKINSRWFLQIEKLRLAAANVPLVCTVPEGNLCRCILVDLLVQIKRGGLISVKQSLMSPAQTVKCLFSTYGLFASIMFED